MASRRKFITALIGSIGLYNSHLASHVVATSLSPEVIVPPDLAPSQRQRRGTNSIDRHALVTRHNPILRKLDPSTPLSIGNGEFAFTADITGLQTFPRAYENAMPLCTMSQWGWHTQPAPASLDTRMLRLVQYETHGRQVGYATSSEGQTERFNWLRENPHRLHLGQIGLWLTTRDKKEIQIADLSEIYQELDLWRGVLTSRFKLAGESVTVRTALHPRLDLLAVDIESNLIDKGQLGVRFAFPYGSPTMQAADWKEPARHETRVIESALDHVKLRRTLDADEYFVDVS